MPAITFLYVTAPNRETAEQIAGILVREKLAACVNLQADMTSVFEWEGRLQEATETAFIVKTTKEKAVAARDRIMALHPYETPCIAALPVTAKYSSEAFLNWVEETTNT